MTAASGEPLERREVGRKTPSDGKLEISLTTAQRLRALGSPLRIIVSGAPSRQPTRRGTGILTTMSCTCAKGGASGSHEHQFLESELFRALPANAPVSLALEEGDTVVVRVRD